MPIFTIIKNNIQQGVITKRDIIVQEEIEGEMVDVLKTAEERVIENLGVGESYVVGAYSKAEYKFVDDLPVELTQAEIDSRAPAKPPSAEELIKLESVELAEAGFATKNSIPFPDEWTKQDAINAINQAAGRARSRSVSHGNLLVMEYERLIIQVNTWIADGRDSLVVPAMLNSYATHSGMTATAAADHIVAASDAYDTLLATTYDKRHEGAAAVMAASSDFATNAQPFIDYLDAL
jgi:hypothetical protein